MYESPNSRPGRQEGARRRAVAARPRSSPRDQKVDGNGRRLPQAARPARRRARPRSCPWRSRAGRCRAPRRAPSPRRRRGLPAAESPPAERARSPARTRPRRSAPAPARSAALTGSPSTVSAIATATSGAVPISTEVRAAPASRTARTNRICESPGAIAPATRNGHTSPRSKSGLAARAIAPVTASATVDIASEPSSGSSLLRRANRTATAIAPKSAAERHARRTAATQAVA